jgi:hypothetical protein
MAEALLKEEQDLTKKDREHIKYFESLENRINEINERLAVLDEKEELTPEEEKERRNKQTWRQRFRSDLKFAQELDRFKKNIKARGGTILTEFKISTDKLQNFDIDGNVQNDLAGQVDVLVVFDETETVEIYDWKTIRKKPDSSPPYYKETNTSSDKAPQVEFGRENGYDTRRQSKHNFQQQIYARVLEMEMGVKVAGVYIIPITIPILTTVPTVGKDGEKKYVLKDNYFFTRTDKQPRDEDNYKPEIAINIKDLYQYDLNKQRVLHHLPNADETAEQKRARMERLKQKNAIKSNEKRDSAIVDNISRMRAELKKRLTEARKLSGKNPEEAKKIKAMIRKFQNDLEEQTDALKAAIYIKNSHFELVGDENTPGLYEKMIKAVDEDDALELMDRFRMQAQSYDILDNIKEALELGLSPEDTAKLQETEEYKMLQAAIAARDNTLRRFFDVAGSMIAQKLSSYRSLAAQDAINDHYAITIAHFKNKIKEHKNNRDKFDSQKVFDKKLKDLENKLALAEEKKTELSVTPEQIVKELKQLPRDISFMSFQAISASSSSDKILSLFVKMTKFRFDDGNMKAKQAAMRLQKAVDDFGGLDGVYKYFLSDNAENFYESILEEGHE